MLQMWPPTPQASQNVYTHNQQAQQSLHPPQSPMPKFRHLTTAGSAQQGDMPYFGMPEMAQGCPAPSPCDHQTQGQYMHKGSTPSPAITQAWSGQQQQGQQQQQQGRPEQWWTHRDILESFIEEARAILEATYGTGGAGTSTGDIEESWANKSDKERGV